MIRVGVFYPLTAKFDWDYYLGKHTPMLQRLMGARSPSTRSSRSRPRLRRTRSRSWATLRTTPTCSRSCRSAK
jgi:hypothetical protein